MLILFDSDINTDRGNCKYQINQKRKQLKTICASIGSWGSIIHGTFSFMHYSRRCTSFCLHLFFFLLQPYILSFSKWYEFWNNSLLKLSTVKITRVFINRAEGNTNVTEIFYFLFLFIFCFSFFLYFYFFFILSFFPFSMCLWRIVNRKSFLKYFPPPPSSSPSPLV